MGTLRALLRKHLPWTASEAASFEALSNPTVIARVLGVLYLAGATIGLVALAFPRPAEANVEGSILLYLVAYGIGSLLLGLREPAPRWAAPAGLFAATAVVCVAILLQPGREALYALFFIWIGVVSFAFLSRWLALMQWLFVGIAYATVLAISAPEGAAEWWFIAVTTVLGAGLLVGSMRRVVDRAISRSAAAERDQREQREFLDAALESLEDGVVACDARGTLTLFNRATREFHGLPERQLPPERWAERYDLYLPDGETPMPMDQIPLYRAFQGEQVRDVEMVIAPKRGPKRVVLASGRAFFGRDGEKLGAVVAMHDITDRKRFELQLRQLADHDAMTGLLNRRRFKEELELHAAAAARAGTDCAVLVLDVDNVKYVNDTLGHGAGDTLIRTIAGVVEAGAGASDVVGRLGGDEFGVVLPESGGERAEAVAKRLVDDVSRAPILVEGHRPRLGVTVGVSTLGDRPTRRAGGLLGEELLVEADIAMHQAKESGRSRFARYSEDVAGAEEGRPNWISRIRHALERRSLVLYGQPIIDLSTGDVAAYELLVRMIDDYGEIVPPSAFLSVAERFDQVQAIDRHMVRKAIELIAERHEAGQEIRLQLNLSARSLGDPELIAIIEREVPRAGIQPGALIFELTETVALLNLAEAKEFAERLGALGCELALDDFGAGFGSFYYLKHLPFDQLKIDGEFVRNLASSPSDEVVVKAIVEIARGLGKRTVAEYVENQPTLDLLRELGVDYAQGFHIRRPAPISELLISEPATLAP